jgi:O-antigen/teichoic acid export membrane protein
MTSFVVLDMNLGMKRSLGISFASGDLGKFKQTVVITCIIVFFTLTICLLTVTITSDILLTGIGIETDYLWSLILLIPAVSFQLIFSEIIISSLCSRRLVIPQLIGAIVRFPILFGSVYLLNLPIVGTIIAYSSLPVICVVFYAYYSFKISKKVPISRKNILNDTKTIMSMSISSWIPHIINILGSQLAIISVFSIEGAADAGKFYLPMAIFTIALFIVTSINRVIHPVIAGLNDEKQKHDFILYSIKISFILTIPLATPLIFFSDDFLSFMGQEYQTAALALSIFMIALPASIITEIVYYFTFALGDRKSVLYLGITGNVPRVLLYFLMVPLIGADGAALAYLVGSFCQLWLSVRISKNYSLKMTYSRYLSLTMIPVSIGIFLSLIDLNYVISTFMIIIISFYLYLKLRYLKPEEVDTIINILLPHRFARPISAKVTKLIKIII